MEKILEAKELELVRQLSINARRRIAGLATGEQRSQSRGSGIEFADYREYQPGDDIRQVDWTVFLRLRRLLIKLCSEEKELTLMILLDTSRSMCFGEPDKFALARKITAVLSGIALYEGNRAGVLTMGNNLLEIVRPGRSRSSLAGVVNSLLRIMPQEQVKAVDCIRQFAARYGHKCMAVLISDLLFSEWPQLINGLSASGCEGFVIQTLAPEELDPPYLGEVTLVDVETMDEAPLHIQEKENLSYRTELETYLNEVRSECRRNRLGYCMVPTDIPIERLFHNDLRKEGLLC